VRGGQKSLREEGAGQGIRIGLVETKIALDKNHNE
jgi:hypothetical protein